MHHNDQTNLKTILLEYFLERNIPIDPLEAPHALKAKTFFEKTRNGFPIFSWQEYEQAFCEILAEIKPRLDVNSSIEDIIKEKENRSALSQFEAKKLMEQSAVKTDRSSNLRIISGGKLLSGTFSMDLYEDILSKHTHTRGRTYWDIFKDSIITAVPVYNPQQEGNPLFLKNNMFFLNTYVQPEWKNFNLRPLPFDELDPILKTFLKHLFPLESTLKQALKWAAYSTCRNLQTYLCMIGLPGIGKTIFAADFLAYYHGYDNFNIVTKISNITRKDKFFGTLFYFDEMEMNSLSQYNTLKTLTNDLVGFENDHVNLTNFANAIWSSNTKEAMRALRKDDRRFKIVDVATCPLNEKISVCDPAGKKIFNFTTENIQWFKNNIEFKQQFVAHLLYILSLNEPIEDINSVEYSLTREEIFLTSRSEEFKNIFQLLYFGIKNDINAHTGLPFIPSAPELADFGEPYEDYIPLSSLKVARDKRYQIKIPWLTIKKVIDIQKTKYFSNISYYRFLKELKEIPPEIAAVRVFNTNNTQCNIELTAKHLDPSIVFALEKFDKPFFGGGVWPKREENLSEEEE